MLRYLHCHPLPTQEDDEFEALGLRCEELEQEVADLQAQLEATVEELAQEQQQRQQDVAAVSLCVCLYSWPTLICTPKKTCNSTSSA